MSVRMLRLTDNSGPFFLCQLSDNLSIVWRPKRSGKSNPAIKQTARTHFHNFYYLLLLTLFHRNICEWVLFHVWSFQKPFYMSRCILLQYSPIETWELQQNSTKYNTWLKQKGKQLFNQNCNKCKKTSIYGIKSLRILAKCILTKFRENPSF